MYSLIERLLSTEVADVKLDLSHEIAIKNLIIEPICMSFRISIDSHEQIELILALLDGHI